jgi:hypothetical protein
MPEEVSSSAAGSTNRDMCQPDHWPPGDNGLQVTISGTNFRSGATLAWLRNGVCEARVQGRSLGLDHLD